MMVDVLDDLGVETRVANAKEVKAIAKAKVKTDRQDSYKLAHLLRMGYIPEVYKRSPENRSSQRVLRQRAFYVGKQTAVKNRLRALLAQQGEEIRQELARVENLFTVKGMRVLEGLALLEREAKMVGALLRTFRHLKERINETNALVNELYESMPSAKLIQTVPGFSRFLSVLAAVWPALRADFDLRAYYDRMKKKKGPNSAKVATARRLLTIIYRMLKENRPYILYKR